MPAFATHYIFAKELFSSLPEGCNVDAVQLGTQGPDFLFYHRLLPHMTGKPSAGIGSRLHAADPAVLFENMRELIGDDIIAKSYVIGFLLHYALDRNAHPYVYCLEDEYIKARHVHYWSFVVHNRIELNIDTVMLSERMGYSDPRDFLPGEKICLDESILKRVGSLAAPAFNKTLSTSLTCEDIVQAYKDMSYVHGLLRNNGGERSALLYTLQFPFLPALGPIFTTATRMKQPDKLWDYMNRNRSEWYFLEDTSRRSTETFDEVFERAKKDALYLIDGFLNGADLALLTQSLSFSTGVSVRA